MPLSPTSPHELLDDLGEAERLALSYAPRAVSAPLIAAFAFDAALQRAALAKSEPVLAQVRLAWWRDACTHLNAAADHPVLMALGENWNGSTKPLLDLIDAWEAFAVAETDFALAAEAVGDARATVFALSAKRSLQAGIYAAARCWTLQVLASRVAENSSRDAMLEHACAYSIGGLPRELRPLAVLGGLARRCALIGTRPLLGDRLSPLAAMRLGIFGR